jgi:hypothetical protein
VRTASISIAVARLQQDQLRSPSKEMSNDVPNRVSYCSPFESFFGNFFWHVARSHVVLAVTLRVEYLATGIGDDSDDRYVEHSGLNHLFPDLRIIWLVCVLN